MKKKMVISLLVAVLVLVGVAGGIYAKGDGDAESGNKLVGLGIMGRTLEDQSPELQHLHSWYTFANPDPVNSIEITKICIRYADGTILYEGPYIQIIYTGESPPYYREIVTRPMEPHELWEMPLVFYMYQGGEDLTDPDSWMTWEEAFDQTLEYYTVEIFWQPTTKSPTCPLIGWQHQAFANCNPSTGAPDYILGDARTESPMINVEYGK